MEIKIGTEPITGIYIGGEAINKTENKPEPTKEESKEN